MAYEVHHHHSVIDFVILLALMQRNHMLGIAVQFFHHLYSAHQLAALSLSPSDGNAALMPYILPYAHRLSAYAEYVIQRSQIRCFGDDQTNSVTKHLAQESNP